MSTFWSLWIIGLTVTNLGLVLWVLLANRKVAVRDDEDPENKKRSHVYDGIEEYDNPLPRWWFNLFIATFIFSAVYLVLYPGMGAFPGVLGWTSEGELRRHQAQAQELYAHQFGAFAETPIEELAHNPQAMRMGLRLFANNCAACHGSDGGGGYGFPDLTNGDWQWGGSPAQIKKTLMDGRVGIMPGWASSLGERGIADVTEYVLKMSGRDHNEAAAERGGQSYAQFCAACHGREGQGNQALGGPDLTNDIWLYGGEPSDIRQTLREGRTGVMPAQRNLLREDRIHLLAAYVYSLSLDHEE
ncbi:cytochrome-c oxidase, cbb3-type subunit III [Marinimicrobium sp. ABcell2]|uniref:cytochrome-c oxidase, cbb3-type subunit III n=1 Tax=Marinimicrobium sp. ABcell2 TaxID=3069751 RepID=UPI0027B84A1A|nr:cytochrome-c oxidase, cbb3-type subunit III [Marinimicrobium sp. ABcell2]MDQ2078455.1 cytochrome-c oxidase, cbb3-type subunit III [Marinimicrobium sp. ABcell2]